MRPYTYNCSNINNGIFSELGKQAYLENAYEAVRAWTQACSRVHVSSVLFGDINAP